MRSAPLAATFALCAACQFDSSPIQPADQTFSGVGSAGQTGVAPAAGSAALPPAGASGALPPAVAPPASAGAGGVIAPPPLIDDGTILDAGAAPHEMPADAGATASVDAATADARTTDASDADAALDAAPPDAEPPPAPGSPFSPCITNSDCDPDLMCTSTFASGFGMPIGGGYCTAWCGQSMGGSNDCPQPSSGKVRATCQYGTICALDTCERSQCPDGLVCVQTELAIAPGQFRYDCLFPQ